MTGESMSEITAPEIAAKRNTSRTATRAARACDDHLVDLAIAYPRGIPNELVIRSDGRMHVFAPVYHGGGISSPAALCAE